MNHNLKYIIKIIITIIVVILSIEAIATMVFGSLGKTPESNEWNYILILYVFLAILGVIVPFYQVKKIKPLIIILSALLGFTLYGFYYGGSISNNNYLIAILTAILFGALGVFISIKKTYIILTTIPPIATVAAYGFAFYAGTNTINLFTVSRLSDAIVWGIVCLIYVGLTVTNLSLTLINIKKY